MSFDFPRLQDPIKPYINIQWDSWGRELTGWYPYQVKPVRDGWYYTMFINDKGFMLFGFSYFNTRSQLWSYTYNAPASRTPPQEDAWRYRSPATYQEKYWKGLSNSYVL